MFLLPQGTVTKDMMYNLHSLTKKLQPIISFTFGLSFLSLLSLSLSLQGKVSVPHRSWVEVVNPCGEVVRPAVNNSCGICLHQPPSVCRCLLLVVGSSAITHGEEGGQEGGGDRNDDECSRVIHVVNARAAGQAARIAPGLLSP